MADTEEVKEEASVENAPKEEANAGEAPAAEPKEDAAPEEHPDEGEPKEDEPLDASKFEPEVRKTPFDYIRERKLRKQQKDELEHLETKDEPVAPESEEFTEELKPAAKKYLEQVAEEMFGKVSRPILDTLAEQEATKELTQFLADPQNAHFRKYAPVVEKYMRHPAYQSVPVSGIFRMLDYENATSRGAEARKEADLAAKKNRSGGTSSRTETPEVDYRKLTPTQYEEIRRQIQEGKTVKP